MVITAGSRPLRAEREENTNDVPVRRLGAEAFGALILTLFGGAAVIGAALTGFAANLLGPLAFGLALFTAINVIGPISGAHCNPTVTAH
jgi:glycerol uptake facilitator-like aquaporin